MRYFDGEVQIEVDDLNAGGSGTNWGHQRTYSNDTAYNSDYGNGFNWLVREWQFLEAEGPSMPWPGSSAMVPATIVAVRGSDSLWFDFNGASYAARYGVLDSLSYDPAHSQFVLTSELGNITRFQDFAQSVAPRGLFDSYTAVGGEEIAVTAYSGQQIAAVERSFNSTVLDALSYNYSPGGDLRGVALQRLVGGVMTNVKQAVYAYYGAGDSNGSAGDLQSATIQTWNASAAAWQTQKVYYYRYWTVGSPPPSSSASGSPSSSSGSSSVPYRAAHLLKYAINPAAYGRMVAAGIDPATASDAVLAQYADLYLEYDSEQRVVKEAVHGGQYVYTFAYFAPGQTSSSSVAGSSGGPSSSSATTSESYNTWAMKTIETRPDGATKTVYTNQIGQVLLTQLVSGADSWLDCQQFDENANLTLHAHPSAVAGFDEAQSDLAISLHASTGLIETFAWFSGASSTLSSASGSSGETPAGRLWASFVQQGSGGTPIMLRQYQYGSQTAGGATIYPVTAITDYRNDDGTGAVTTSYAYLFYSGTLAVQQRTTTYPAVSAAQNGSGIAATRQEYLDQLGNPIWEMGPRGFIMYQAYDAASGGLVRRIDDFDTSLPNQPAPPAGWTTPAGGGLNLITDYEVDSLGRATQELGPWHTVDISGTATTIRTATWTVYQDSTDSGAASEIWTAQGYGTLASESSSSSSGGGAAGDSAYDFTLVNPVSITRSDDDGQVTDQISAIRSDTNGALSASDSFAQASYCRWTHNIYNDAGQFTATQVYYLIPASGAGAQGANYNETDFGFDGTGRQNKTVAPGGTISRTVLDARDLPLSVYIGTNDNGATDADPTGGGAQGNNMVAVQINQYDGGTGGGDGNLTMQTLPVDGNSANDRVTAYLYDWRNRQTQVTAPQDSYVVNTFDTMNRVTQADRYASATNTLIGRVRSLYDDRGRVYQTVQFGVDPNTGAVGNSLVDNIWYDAGDNVIKQLPAGSSAFTKNVYDGAKRRTTKYVGYDLGAGESDYASASDVADDTIVEQTEATYDAASNVIQTTFRQRFHNATGTGPLTYPGGAQPQARATHVALYPDALGRPQAEANYGTNGDAVLTRPATIPATSTAVLVSLVVYNSRGEAYQSVDPAGRLDQTTFDDAGRRTQLVLNVRAQSSSSSSSSGSSSGDTAGLPASDDQNNTTLWSYTADSLIATLTAVNAATGNQVTSHDYGTSLPSSDVARNDVPGSMTYPDGGQIFYLVNRQSQVKQFTDQRQVVHQYEFDLLGRQVQDLVVSLGDGSSSSSGSSSSGGPRSVVDGAIRRIAQTYEVRGLPQNVTSYSSAVIGQGTIVNDVQRV